MAYFTGNVAYKNTVSTDIDAEWRSVTISSDHQMIGTVNTLSLTSFSVISLDVQVSSTVSLSSIVFDLSCNSMRNTTGTIVIERITGTIENMINIGIIEYNDSKLKITNPGMFIKDCNYRIRGQIII